MIALCKSRGMCCFQSNVQGQLDTESNNIDIEERRERERLKMQRKMQKLEMKLHLQKYGAIKGENKQISCSICLEEFEETTSVRQTQCNHLFHDQCLIRWIKLKIEQPECPYCKQLIKA